MSSTSTAPNRRRKPLETNRTLVQGPLSDEELRKMDAYWRASNYFSVRQIYRRSTGG